MFFFGFGLCVSVLVEQKIGNIVDHLAEFYTGGRMRGEQLILAALLMPFAQAGFRSYHRLINYKDITTKCHLY
jgi:hypothetical protein